MIQGKTVLPLSGAHEVGVNVPCLKHYFRCLETSGNTIVDSKGGVTWTNANLQFDSSLGTITTTDSDTVDPTPITGSWHSFAPTDSAVFMYVGRVTSTGACCRVAMGDSNGTIPASNHRGWGLSDVPLHTVINSGTEKCRAQTLSYVTGTTVVSGGNYTVPPTTPTFSTQSNGTDLPFVAATGSFVMTGSAVTGVTVSTPGQGYIWSTIPGVVGGVTGGTWTSTASVNYTITPGSLYYDFQGYDVLVVAKYTPGSGFVTSVYNLNTTEATLLQTLGHNNTGTYSKNVGAFQPYPVMRTSSLKLYSIMVFAFSNGIPTNFDTYAKWMGYQAKLGNRYIDPRLIDQT